MLILKQIKMGKPTLIQSRNELGRSGFREIKVKLLIWANLQLAIAAKSGRKTAISTVHRKRLFEPRR